MPMDVYGKFTRWLQLAHDRTRSLILFPEVINFSVLLQQYYCSGIKWSTGPQKLYHRSEHLTLSLRIVIILKYFCYTLFYC
jgi:hypothetical protein